MLFGFGNSKQVTTSAIVGEYEPFCGNCGHPQLELEDTRRCGYCYSTVTGILVHINHYMAVDSDTPEAMLRQIQRDYPDLPVQGFAEPRWWGDHPAFRIVQPQRLSRPRGLRWTRFLP